MTEMKTHTVMELADALGVPRTTVNDWLGKYARYIDFQNVGRRRVYPESALAVLKDISELRNKGLSFPAIETELEKTHAVRAEEVADTVVASIPKEAGKHERPSGEEQGKDKPSEDFALIAKHQSDEIGRVIGESFRDMAGRLHELETKADSAGKRLCLGYVLVFLLLLALTSGLFLLFRTARIESVKQTKTGETVQELSARTVSLAGSTGEVQKNLRELERGLEQQKKEFKEAMRELKSSRESEIRMMKEKFAAERAALLKDLDNMSRDKDQIIRELQEKLRTREEQRKEK